MSARKYGSPKPARAPTTARLLAASRLKNQTPGCPSCVTYVRTLVSRNRRAVGGGGSAFNGRSSGILNATSPTNARPSNVSMSSDEDTSGRNTSTGTAQCTNRSERQRWKPVRGEVAVMGRSSESGTFLQLATSSKVSENRPFRSPSPPARLGSPCCHAFSVAAGILGSCLFLLHQGACAEPNKYDPANVERMDARGGTGGGQSAAGSGGTSQSAGGAGGSGGAGGVAMDASAGGTAGAADGPEPTPDMNTSMCSAGATRCASMGAAVEVCTIDGTWVMKETCSAICTAGACAGMCTPGTNHCGTNQTPETCDSNGEWVPAAMPCPNVCSGLGECTGMCKPGTKRCSGTGNLTTQRQGSDGFPHYLALFEPVTGHSARTFQVRARSWAPATTYKGGLLSDPAAVPCNKEPPGGGGAKSRPFRRYLMKFSVSTVSALVACGAFAFLGLASPARAHFNLMSPPANAAQNNTGDPQKAPPCGGGATNNVVTTVKAGEMLRVAWRETVYHPGHYRIPLSANTADFVDPVVMGANCGRAAIQNPPVMPVLADGVNVKSTQLQPDVRDHGEDPRELHL